MTNKTLVQKALEIASRYDTIYLWGTFGAPLTEKLIAQKVKQYPKNYSESRQTYLKKQIQYSPWAFDCVGLIKGILWGWTGDEDKTYGGAVYRSKDVPDINAGTMAKRTLENSEDFETILPGEVVFKSGHIGIYAGEGKVVEATLDEKTDGITISDLWEGNWVGHGKLPWVEYEEESHSPEVGDRVLFSGNRHYTSSNGDKSFPATAGPAQVTLVAEGKKHPYHIIHTDKTSNVYGWVDESTVTKAT